MRYTHYSMRHLRSVPGGNEQTNPSCLAQLAGDLSVNDSVEQQLHTVLADQTVYLQAPEIVGFDSNSGSIPELLHDIPNYLALRYIGVQTATGLTIASSSQRRLAGLASLETDLALFSHAPKGRRYETVAGFFA